MLGEKEKAQYVAKLREKNASLPWHQALASIIAEAYEDGHAEGARKAYREGFNEAQRQAFSHAKDAIAQAASDFDRRISHRQVA